MVSKLGLERCSLLAVVALHASLLDKAEDDHVGFIAAKGVFQWLPITDEGALGPTNLLSVVPSTDRWVAP
jgi:hypothetical protein